jgi:hypothetical protein
MNASLLPAGRRGLMRDVGLAGTLAGLAGTGLLGTTTRAQAQAVSDTDILNFALNLEYLEAEYYLRATTGMGLSGSDTGGTGNQGTVTGGSAVPFHSKKLQQLAAEIAQNEKEHVEFLRTALGSKAVAEPSINLYDSFNAAAMAAGLGNSFNPFADEVSFLIGAYIFEDVGVTAYNGAAPLITSKTYLGAAASILAVEAYHAGSIRTLLLELGQAAATAKISALRASASNAADDQGVLNNGMVNIFPVDTNALAFARTTAQVLNIVYLGGASANYGFFPDRLNGTIS